MGRHTSRIFLLMREQESKDETDSFMKVATEVVFTQISEKVDIKKFLEKKVAVMVKEYKQIEKGPMEGKPFVTPIDPTRYPTRTIVRLCRRLTL